MQRKKQRTRDHIAATAIRLFLAEGFEQVSVTDVAAAAEVAEKTVYNHFPTKAALVFDEDPEVLAGLLGAVRARASGQSVWSAVRAYLPDRAARLGSRRPGVDHAAFRAMVLSSPSLREHQRSMAARYEEALAPVIAEQTDTDPGTPEPYITAVAIVGALRAAFDTGPRAGGAAPAVARALDLLGAGLAADPITDHEPGNEIGLDSPHRAAAETSAADDCSRSTP